MIGTQMLLNAGILTGVYYLSQEEESMRKLGQTILFIAGAYSAAALAKAALGDKRNALATAAAVGIVGGAITVGLGTVMANAMKPPELPTYDMGGRIYDTGGALGSRHFPVMVEPGETIIPKTQNMLGGGGITLNIGGDIVTNDAEDFAERIAQVLPEALRRQNDIGGI